MNYVTIDICHYFKLEKDFTILKV